MKSSNKVIRLITIFNFFSVFILTACTTESLRSPQSNLSHPNSLQAIDTSPSIFITRMIPYDTVIDGKINLRSGFMLESTNILFKACVMYLPGLGDSIMNHQPLFQHLSNNGYRVITFDYMGQGGSEGEMNSTRLASLIPPNYPKALEIGEQARFIWNYYSQDNINQPQTCKNSKKIVMGWSTGGLATFKLANDKWAEQVILIAPGIFPKTFVGESAQNSSIFLSSQDVITERTLTTQDYSRNIPNPHKDPIKPTSPIRVPLFAADLIFTSKLSHTWKISDSIPGLVFLSGDNDTYVDRIPTQELINKNNPHFEVITYEKALHEIDNETKEITNDMYSRIIYFLNSKK